MSNDTPHYELRIFTPIGNVGYGYSTEIFWSTVKDLKPHAIVCDSGSTDSGPQKLALGSSTVPRESYECDLEPMVAAAHSGTPVIIGSAGGDGADAHVDMFVDIIDSVVATRGYRSLKIIKIYAEIPKEVLQQALESSPSRIAPCGAGVAPLIRPEIEASTRIVAQMGMQPFLDAMHDHPDFDMIIAGRAYDPAPYAALCYYHGFRDLGLAYHMGKVMECGAQCATPKSREAFATVRKDSFDIMPLDPAARCTPLSVAAHTLYEKSRPDLHYGPDGVLDLTHSSYTALPDGRSVRVQGSAFTQSTPESRWTVKLEGAKVGGYHSMFIGGCADPILISQLDDLLVRVRAYVASKCAFEYGLKLTVYGREAALNMLGTSKKDQGPTSVSPVIQPPPATVGILGQARAATQEEANMVVAMARVACVHGPYKGQKATSGNFGMPAAPLEISLGPISSFNIYHLMTVDSPTKAFPFSLHVSDGPGSRGDEVDKSIGPGALKSTERGKQPSADAVRLSEGSPEPYVFAPDQLGALASVIRSKNAGPFEVTFDVIFSTQSPYTRVKDSNILTRGKIASLYGLEEADVLTAMWWPQALAFKATVVRSAVSGGWGEVDVHSSTQHVKLMHLEIPNVTPGKSVECQDSILSTMLRVSMSRTRLPALLAACTAITISFRYWDLVRRSSKH
ncbi:hypothetical protein MBLNU13_g08316t2 [Cladosporium sp. NU13]